jgi:hypothetical protein
VLLLDSLLAAPGPGLFSQTVKAVHFILNGQPD